MASNSGRKSGSSGRSSSRKRVVIGAEETTRVRYSKDRPQVESERRKTPRQTQRAASERAGIKGGPKPTGAGRKIAAEKRDERDRRRRSISRRRIMVGLAIVAVAAGVVWGAAALWRAPLFSVTSIEVTGNKHLSANEVRARAAVPGDATLLRLSPRAVEQHVAVDPWVASVSVSRRLPHALEINIVERTPAALVDAGGTEMWLVSDDGHWLGKPSTQDTSAVVTIRDIESLTPTASATSDSPELRNALAILRGMSPALKGKVKAVSAPSVDKTALILDNDVQVFIGSADSIAKKDLIARGILAREKNLVYINVRVVERPTWRGLGQGN